MICSICIATYNRPLLLKKLLDSINNQQLPENIFFEVIVVDNDYNSSAQKILEDYKFKDRIIAKYFNQPIKNISLTRNLAIEKSTGEYLYFIDDDEIAENNWICNLLNCLIKFKADGVFGQVKSYFAKEIPMWKRSSFLYHRTVYESGTLASELRTGNCLLKKSLLKKLDGPFDPSHGLTGGEDTLLFNKLMNQGAKFINCKEAITLEYVPYERSTIIWQLKRALRVGNIYVRRQIDFTSIKSLMIIFTLIKSLTYILISFTLCLLLVFNRKLFLHWLLKITTNIGKITGLMGVKIKGY